VAARVEFAQRMARRFLKRHRVLAPPVPVEFILFSEGVQVAVLTYPDETAGESWWEGEVAHLAVNRALPDGRRRFTLAHEWGHLVLRHHQRRFEDLAAPLPRFRHAAEANWALTDPVEVEANQFAAELLMPLALFRRDWERNPNPHRLAQRYEVSHEALRWRAHQLSPAAAARKR
jgi:Zn-dependent peptidase ImmA (M78 family)